MQPLYNSMKKRHGWQWLYAAVTVLALLFGWKYPALGFLVLAAMLGGTISGLLAGRWFCGNLCPRGGFLERIVAKISRGKPSPAWLRSTPVRVFFMCFLVTMLTLNISRNPTAWQQWGLAFWTVCVVTTAFGIVLSLFWNARSWCSICPMGTMQNWTGGTKYALAIDPEKCKRCKKCEKVCPMHLSIIEASGAQPQTIVSKDCLRCGECIATCPTKTLHFVEKNGNKCHRGMP